jgi:predicted enzyme related to lactoylglutathione lyase
MQTKSTPTNAINWFEIPVANLDRAAAFYTTVIGRPLKHEVFGGVPHAMFATAETKTTVTGALIEDATRPRGAGVTIYLDVAGVQAAVERALAAGGKVIQPTTDIGPFGTIALIADLDGNVVGVHTEAVAS